jgi:hypothetical protein
VRGSEGVEVDWGDTLEEFALMEDPDEVSTDESTKAVSSNGELHVTLFEFFYFLEDLVRNGGIERPNCTHEIDGTRVGGRTSSATRSPP